MLLVLLLPRPLFPDPKTATVCLLLAKLANGCSVLQCASTLVRNMTAACPGGPELQELVLRHDEL